MLQHAIQTDSSHERVIGLIEKMQVSIAKGTCKRRRVFLGLIRTSIECTDVGNLCSWLDLSSPDTVKKWSEGLEVPKPIHREYKIVRIAFFLRHQVSVPNRKLH